MQRELPSSMPLWIPASQIKMGGSDSVVTSLFLLQAYERSRSTFSLSAAVNKLEKRVDQIQQWLSLDQETTDEWKLLGGRCVRWTVAGLEKGQLQLRDIADLFPVTWKKYLTETDQTDDIKARCER